MDGVDFHAMVAERITMGPTSPFKRIHKNDIRNIELLNKSRE